MQKITVTLDERSYPICVGNGILDSFLQICEQKKIPRQIAMVTDRNVAKLHGRTITKVLKQYNTAVLEIVIPAGERQKSLVTANMIITRLLEARFSRRSALIAFGGGVVGDVSGFAAATFRRGIPLIQVPTTLLAQVESAIGGKTAVNHPLSKNAIGAYHQPAFVFSDIHFLSTLSKREIICGVGEILKYGMLDQDIFSFLDHYLEDVLSGKPDILEEIVLRCNVIKTKLIQDDEREECPSGGRAVLNLGHTVGHVLEDLSNYKLHHGEAVVLGLRWELQIAKEAGIIDNNDCKMLDALLHRIPFHPKIEYINRDKIIQRLITHASSGGFVLPKKIGKVIITREIPAKIIRSISRSFKS